MPYFLFEARNSQGERSEGELEAPSLDLAAEQLMRRQLIPIRIIAKPVTRQFSWRIELWPK